MSDKQRSICIAVLCGIPGSGKTTLSLALCAYCSNFDGSTCVLHVDYDKILNECVARSFCAPDFTTVSSSWRSARKDVAQCVKLLIGGMLEDVKEDKYQPEKFRTDFTSAVQSRFYEVVSSRIPASYSRLVIVIDDNMYYRSMRYEYFTIARNYGTGFAEIHVDVPLSVAVARNSKRKESVPEEIIVAMATKVEPPDQKYTWERDSCCVMNDGSQPLQSLVTKMCQAIENAFSNPITAKVDASSTDKLLSKESVMHQVDIFLRKLVRDHVTCVKSSEVSRDDLRQAADRANAARLQLLTCLKDGSLYLPAFVTADDCRSLPTATATIMPPAGDTPQCATSLPWQGQLISMFNAFIQFGK